MHDIWNPWHGCVKKSEGCDNCYMYFLDRQRNADGRRIYKVKSNFDYPLQKDRSGSYRVMSGEQLRVCMTSDFFLAEADGWRNEAWRIIKQRPDVVFFSSDQAAGAGGGLSAAGLGRRLGKRFFQCYLRKSKAGGRANPDYVQTAF